MISTIEVDREASVAGRFDLLHSRFKSAVSADDPRLRGVLAALGPAATGQILDLGCGKGRFAARLQESGAEVVGLDRSGGMLRHAAGTGLVLGSACRLPFADRSFDGVVAIEVLQHVGARGVPLVLSESFRVLRPGGRIAIVDRNAAALDSRRPWLPALVVKRLDEWRGLAMFASGNPVRERWFWPGRLANQLRRRFVDVRVDMIATGAERGRVIFEALPRVRRMAVWSGMVLREAT